MAQRRARIHDDSFFGRPRMHRRLAPTSSFSPHDLRERRFAPFLLQEDAPVCLVLRKQHYRLRSVCTHFLPCIERDEAKA